MHCAPFLNTGPGIPVDYSDRVFDPFFSGKDQGQGLGLAVARDLVSSHGGEIKVLRRRGSGAHIQFDVPLKRSRATL